MSRHRSGSKKVAPEIGLHMECVEEELEAAQISYYSKAEKEYIEVQSKLDNYIKKLKGEVVEKGENCIVLQLNTTSQSVALGPSTPNTNVKATRQPLQVNQNFQQIVPQGIITRSTANSAGNTYLVMDPRLGFMVGQMPSTNVPNEQPSTQLPPKSMSSGRSRQNSASGTLMLSTRAKSSSKKQCTTPSDSEVLTPPITRTRDKAKNQFQIHQQSLSQTSSQEATYCSTNTSTSNGYKIKMNARHIPPISKPTENNALGGLSAGSKTPWRPYGESTTNKSSADSKEVTFNKVSGKTFPSLVVVARPHLKAKFISQSNATQERTALDAKVKGVLMFTSTKFTEWLIQQGLIRSEQSCQTHVNNDLSPVKLKLGMYSDVSKFPYSGGYVWISDCCPSNFVSVFSGSIFEGAPHPPTTLLKLIYHWACQTNVQNIVQWVKIDNLYVKNFFTNMRAVCTQAVHEKYKKMGGPRKKIEVGVISLGTTSQDGNRRQVKVEVLGVMDFENKLVRLRAVEPHSDERSFKRRFVRILEPLEEWVCKDSTILTDFTVNKAALNSMGFHSVLQVTTDVKYSNQNVMEYLRRIVPRMFQNTLSLLSRQIIQQFLDELVWREVWGSTASQAFTNIIAHMAEQTKLDVSENFLARLTRVSTNPFKHWNYASWNPVTNNSFKTQHKSITTQDDGMAPLESVSETSGKNNRTRKRLSDQSVSEDIISPPKKVTKISPSKEKSKKEDKIKTFEKVVKREKEAIDKLPEETIKFINEGKQILLENYYYGHTNSQYRPSQSIAFFNVKCCICNKRFTENIILMKHMILHCQMEPELTVDLKKVQQCENCFLGFNSEGAVKMHLEEVHHWHDNKLDSMFICHICEKKFNDRIELIYHMHRSHVQLELPYECGVCHYRTSVYKGFVDHFIQIHGGEEHVFCPFCLKVVTLSHKGTSIPLNVFFYLSHLEKHQRLTLAKECHRCRLSFIHGGILNQHLEADHDTKKDETSVQFIKDISTKTLMPEPNGTIKPVCAVESDKLSKTRNLFTFTKFKSLDIQCFEEDTSCVECEGFFTNLEHFTGTFNCTNCQYTTCCERAILEHVEIFHELKPPRFTLGKPIELAEEMFCICGYSSRSGNRIAKHLALCDKKIAYSSKDLSTLCLQLKPTKNQSQENSKALNYREGQNVLNMLGLVRKSPEVVISKDEIFKKDVKCEETLNDLNCKKADEGNEVNNEKCPTEEETKNVLNFMYSSDLEAKDSLQNTNITNNDFQEAKEELNLEENKKPLKSFFKDEIKKDENNTNSLESSPEFPEKPTAEPNNDLHSLSGQKDFDVEEEKENLENVQLSIEEKNLKIKQGTTEPLTDMTKEEKAQIKTSEYVEAVESKISVDEVNVHFEKNSHKKTEENIKCQEDSQTEKHITIDSDSEVAVSENLSVLPENTKDKSAVNREEVQIENKLSDLEMAKQQNDSEEV